MGNSTLVRAWKDEEFRLSLSEADQALLPGNPAGSLELTDAELDLVAGGWRKKKHSGGDTKITVRVSCFQTVQVCGFTNDCYGTICGVTNDNEIDIED
jgi:mersacidin/lichenicidin family type 2 lantibiotic